MRILLLTQVLPFPPDSGPKIKTWNLLKHLSQNHRVTLVSFVRGDQSRDVSRLEAVCERVIPIPLARPVWREGVAMARSFASGEPWLVLRDERRAMRQVIAALAQEERFDIVHADQLGMAQYAALVPGSCRVLDAHNALWQLYQRLWQTLPPGPYKWLWGREWPLLKRYEGAICRQFDGVLAVSRVDQRALEEASGESGKVRVVPISVDLEEFPPIRRAAGASHILSMGTMFWQPNVEGVLWFAREILPFIRRERPDVVFDVLGARPPEAVTRLAQQDERIRVTGYVPDPALYLEQAGAVIVPLLAGSGMRVKILQALAQELPVVTTSTGCEGIDVENGRHVFIADTPAEFSQAVLRLLADPQLGRELGRQGRALIQSRYEVHTALAAVDQAYVAWQGETINMAVAA